MSGRKIIEGLNEALEHAHTMPPEKSGPLEFQGTERLLEDVARAIDKTGGPALSTDARRAALAVALEAAVKSVNDVREQIGPSVLGTEGAAQAQYERGIVAPYLDAVEDYIRALIPKEPT